MHGDHLGSTNVVTDENGEVVQTLDYYPYGSERIDSGTDVSDRQFIGERFDEETDLSYLNARYYSGDRGQFLSQDPVFWEIGQTEDGIKVLTNPQLQNSYGYGGNNPIANKDPGGRLIDTIADIAFIGYDLYKIGEAIATGGDVREQAAYLGLDVAGAFTPFGTGFGLAGRVAKSAGKVDNILPADRAKHIFGNRPGHIPDTAANRGMLRDLANNPNTKLGVDKHGNTWSARTNKDGTQTWVQSRGGKIINGGVNTKPKTWDPKTGLSSPSKPKSKENE